jgi:DNA-binding GntR family transcriptional regulator
MTVGLLKVLPSRGTYVVKISVRDVLNARFVRESIKSAIVRIAADLAVAADVERLDRNIDKQLEAVSTGDIARFYRLDEDFHRIIAEIADCPQALRVVEQSRAQIDRVRYLSLPNATPVATLVRQHRDIAAGIRAVDPAAAELAMRTHLREILSVLPKLKAQFPDLFDTSDPPRHAEPVLRRIAG